MEIIGEPERNQNDGELEIRVKLNYPEVDLLKGAIAKYTGDVDDPKQVKLAGELKNFLLECKSELKPS